VDMYLSYDSYPLSPSLGQPILSIFWWGCDLVDGGAVRRQEPSATTDDVGYNDPGNRGEGGISFPRCDSTPKNRPAREVSWTHTNKCV
jgi:hypothetical protein